jgi:hypothetical protein
MGILHWKWIPTFMTVLSVVIDHEHWLCCTLIVQKFSVCFIFIIIIIPVIFAVFIVYLHITLRNIDAVMSISSRTSSVSALSEAMLPSIEQAEPGQKHHTRSSASSSIAKGKYEGCTLQCYKPWCRQFPGFVLVLCLYFQRVRQKCLTKNITVI